jgi:hypothetical protein
VILRTWGAAVLRPYKVWARRDRAARIIMVNCGGSTEMLGAERLVGLGRGWGWLLVLQVVEELFGFGVVGSEGEGFLCFGARQRELV